MYVCNWYNSNKISNNAGFNLWSYSQTYCNRFCTCACPFRCSAVPVPQYQQASQFWTVIHCIKAQKCMRDLRNDDNTTKRIFHYIAIQSVQTVSQYFADRPILWSLPLTANLYIYKNVSNSSGRTYMYNVLRWPPTHVVNIMSPDHMTVPVPVLNRYVFCARLTH